MTDNIQKTTVYSTPWFELIAKTFDSTPADAPYYSLTLADYVTIVAVTQQGQFVLVRQFRPAVEQITLELPAGTVDAGETPEQSAKRELEEETGYRAESLELLGVLEPDTGRLSNRMWCYFAKNVVPVPGWTLEEPEIETVLQTQQELIESIGNSELTHALHLAALFLCVFKGRSATLQAS